MNKYLKIILVFLALLAIGGWFFYFFVPKINLPRQTISSSPEIKGIKEWLPYIERASKKNSDIVEIKSTLTCLPINSFLCTAQDCTLSKLSSVFTLITPFNTETGKTSANSRYVYNCDENDCTKMEFLYSKVLSQDFLSHSEYGVAINVDSSSNKYSETYVEEDSRLRVELGQCYWREEIFDYDKN